MHNLAACIEGPCRVGFLQYYMNSILNNILTHNRFGLTRTLFFLILFCIGFQKTGINQDRSNEPFVVLVQKVLAETDNDSLLFSTFPGYDSCIFIETPNEYMRLNNEYKIFEGERIYIYMVPEGLVFHEIPYFLRFEKFRLREDSAVLAFITTSYSKKVMEFNRCLKGEFLFNNSGMDWKLIHKNEEIIKCNPCGFKNIYKNTIKED